MTWPVELIPVGIAVFSTGGALVGIVYRNQARRIDRCESAHESCQRMQDEKRADLYRRVAEVEKNCAIIPQIDERVSRMEHSQDEMMGRIIDISAAVGARKR